jgi:hypothetical protein
MVHDVITETPPIATQPVWGVPDGPGLGIAIDDDAVAEASARYRVEGQYLPYQPEMIGREEGQIGEGRYGV